MDLQTARAQAGISQKKLADLLGVSQTTLSFYEHGQSRPTHMQHTAMQAICNARIDDPQPRDEPQEKERLQFAFNECVSRIGNNETIKLFTHMAQQGPVMLNKLVNTMIQTAEDGIEQPRRK